MAFPLGLVVIVSLVMIIAGFVLSHRTHHHDEQETSYEDERYSTPRRASSVPARASRSMRPAASFQSSQVIEDIEPRSFTQFMQILSGRRLFGQRKNEPTSWIGIVLILVAIFVGGTFLLNLVLPSAHLGSALFWTGFASSSSNQQSQSSNAPPATNLTRLSQLDPAQYNSPQEYKIWAYSACSAAAMTEVINAYGHHYRVTDILGYESQIGEITPQLGLLEDIGVARTVSHFGFNATYMHNEKLDDVLNIANQGRPVIVSFPPDRYDGGHILVVLGGNSSSVSLADSSRYNRQTLSRTQFMNWWGGFAVIITPK
ncbi:MAG: hypothetical protein M3Z24_05595 [Chloroflexota bacterium]|nr:hypothetical protein [Chloroflexota bacterium]